MGVKAGVDKRLCLLFGQLCVDARELRTHIVLALALELRARDGHCDAIARGLELQRRAIFLAHAVQLLRGEFENDLVERGHRQPAILRRGDEQPAVKRFCRIWRQRGQHIRLPRIQRIRHRERNRHVQRLWRQRNQRRVH